MDLFIPAVAPGLKAPPEQTLEKENIRFEVINLSPEARLICRVIGDPAQLLGECFREEDCRSVAFSNSSFGLGLGAFGSNFADCAGRFGEFLAVCDLPPRGWHKRPRLHAGGRELHSPDRGSL
jgi:hypothetical protein